MGIIRFIEPNSGEEIKVDWLSPQPPTDLDFDEISAEWRKARNLKQSGFAAPPVPGRNPDQPGYYNRSGGGEGSALNTPFEWADTPGQWAQQFGDFLKSHRPAGIIPQDVTEAFDATTPPPPRSEPLSPESVAGLRRSYPATMGIEAAAARRVPEFLDDPTNLIPFGGKWLARAFSPGLVVDTGVGIERAKAIYEKEGASANFWEAAAEAGLTGAFATAVGMGARGEKVHPPVDYDATPVQGPQRPGEALPGRHVDSVPDEMHPLSPELREKSAAAAQSPHRERVHTRMRAAFVNLPQVQMDVALWAMDKFAAKVKEVTGGATDYYEMIADVVAGKEPGNKGETGPAADFAKTGHLIIKAFEAHDFSTAIHEATHALRPLLGPRDLAILEAWLGVEGHNWTRAHDENLARASEMYVKTRKAPTPELARVFEKMNQWMGEIYSHVKKGLGGHKDYKVKMTPEVEAWFDEIYGLKEAPPAPEKPFSHVEEAFVPKEEFFSLGDEPPPPESYMGPPEVEETIPLDSLEEPGFTPVEEPLRLGKGRSLRLKERPLVPTTEPLVLKQADGPKMRVGPEEAPSEGRKKTLDSFALLPDERKAVYEFLISGRLENLIPFIKKAQDPNRSQNVMQAIQWAERERKKANAPFVPKVEDPNRPGIAAPDQMAPPPDITAGRAKGAARAREDITREEASGKALPAVMTPAGRPRLVQEPIQIDSTESILPQEKKGTPNQVGTLIKALSVKGITTPEPLAKRAFAGEERAIEMVTQMLGKDHPAVRGLPKKFKAPDEGPLKQSDDSDGADKVVDFSRFRERREESDSTILNRAITGGKVDPRIQEKQIVLAQAGKTEAAKILARVAYHMGAHKMSPEKALDYVRRTYKDHKLDDFIDAAAAVDSLRREPPGGKVLPFEKKEPLKQSDDRRTTQKGDMEDRRVMERRIALRREADRIYNEEYMPLLTEEDSARTTFDDQPIAKRREEAYERYKRLTDEANALSEKEPLKQSDDTPKKVALEHRIEELLHDGKLGAVHLLRKVQKRILTGEDPGEALVKVLEEDKKAGKAHTFDAAITAKIALKQSAPAQGAPSQGKKVFKRGPIGTAFNEAVELVKASGVGGVGTAIRNATAGTFHILASSGAGPVAAFSARKRAAKWEKMGRHREAAEERAAAERFMYISKRLPTATFESAGEALADTLAMFHIGKGSQKMAERIQFLKDAGVTELAEKIEHFSTTNVKMGDRLDKTKKALMIMNILGDRTFNGGYVTAHLEAFMKEIGAKSYSEALSRMEADKSLKRRFQWYIEEMGGEAFKTTWQLPFANESLRTFHQLTAQESPVINAAALLLDPYYKATFANLVMGATELFPTPQLQGGRLRPSLGEFHMSKRVRNSFEHDALRQQVRVLEDRIAADPLSVDAKKWKKEKAKKLHQMHLLEKARIYNIHTARARMMIGPTLMALSALYTFAKGDKETEFDQLITKRDSSGKAVMGRFFSGSMGEYLFPIFWGNYIGHYARSKVDGKPFKYDTKEGRTKIFGLIGESFSGSRYGIPSPAQEVLSEIAESFMKPGKQLDLEYIKRLALDSFASVGRMGASGLPFDVARLGAEARNPEERFTRRTDTTPGELTAKKAPGEVVRALARGFQSRIPDLGLGLPNRLSLPKSPDWKNLDYGHSETPIQDALTGLPAAKIGAISRFVNAHEGKISMSDILPKRTGDPSYDDIHLREWKKEAAPLLGLFDHISSWDEDLQIAEVLRRFKKAREDAASAAAKAYKKETGKLPLKAQQKKDKEKDTKELSRRLKAQRRATGPWSPKSGQPSPPPQQ